MNPSKDGGIHFVTFLIVQHEGTQTILLKTYRPNNGRVVLSDGLPEAILHVTQISALQSKQVSVGC